MRKRKAFILAVTAFSLFSVFGQAARAEEETAGGIPAENSMAEEPEMTQTVTADLYQAGALGTDDPGISAYSLQTEEMEAQICQSLTQVLPELDVSAWGLTTAEAGYLKNMFEHVVNGHPELFYVSNKYSYRYKNSGEILAVVWDYREKDPGRIASMKAAMEEKISGILTKTDPSMTEVEKLLVLHDALVTGTVYTSATEWGGGSGCYTAYCALVEGRAVCQGYALAFDLLAERLGIWTEFVASTELDHAWNLVLLEGGADAVRSRSLGVGAYHVDCTWDDRDRPGEVLHRNFMLSDSGIRSTGHTVWNDPGLSGTETTYDAYYWREPAYDYEFVKSGSVWYQIDRPEAPSEEWKRIGASLMNPEILSALYQVRISETECRIEKGKTKQLSLSALPGLEGKTVLWRSSDEGVAAVDAFGKVTGLRTGTARIYASVDGITRSCQVQVGAAVLSLRYQAHVQSRGWQDEVSDGVQAGTRGQAKRLEALKIRVSGNADVGVAYQAHVQSQGWQSEVSDGDLAGTENQAKRMEAIRIRLTGNGAEDYDIYYRVYVQTYGWLGWAKNGESAGTEGLAKRLEAVEIKIVEKGSQAPGSMEDAFRKAQPGVSYQTHVQSYGWQSLVSDGAPAGTTGRAKRLEAIRISLSNLPVSGGIRYQTHVQSEGWQDWKSDGAAAGISGRAKRLEAIRIELTGAFADQYDVCYRVHVQSEGWQDWVKNGETAGTVGRAKRLEAIEIRLEKKS